MKPSAVREVSYGSVNVFWLDRRKALTLALEACKKILEDRKEVLRAGVFGSVATGRTVPGSDLDILLVLRELPAPRHHAAAPYAPYFRGIDLGIEIHCATEAAPAYTRSGLTASSLKARF